MNTYLWLNREGEFLYISEHTTHTGHHIKGYFTKDVNLAYVGADLPRKARQSAFTNNVKEEDLTKVPAWAERKVFVGAKPEIKE